MSAQRVTLMAGERGTLAESVGAEAVLDPRVEYSKRLETHLRVIADKERVHVLLGNSKLATIVVGLIFVWLYFGRHALALHWVLVPVAI